VQRAGERIDGHPHENTAWRFPTPAALAAVDLAQIGMPGKRVAALQGFAHAVASGDVPLDSNVVDASNLRAALLALPGIGPWTVEYVAMRAWRDADAWPAWDLVLMQSICARDPSLTRPTQQRARTDTRMRPCICGTRWRTARAPRAAPKAEHRAATAIAKCAHRVPDERR
jgi:DNA-3-methyladenine glycosylase II